MSIYSKSYWDNVVQIISELIPKDVILSYILPILHINLERLRFETLSFLIPFRLKNFKSPGYIRSLIKKSDFINSLILLENTYCYNKWLSIFDIMILNMNYENLIKIKNFSYPLHITHYFYWKLKKFYSNYHIERTSFISKKVLKHNTSKLLWGYEEINNYKLNDNVIILVPCEEKGYSTVNGYISFDDSVFEGNRRYIGLSNKKNKVEIFDTKLYNNEEFKVFIQNKFTDNAFIKINNINFHYNFKECNKIFPWDLKPDDMCIITYGPINKRNIKTFFVKEIKKNFNKIIMVNKNCKKKIINFSLIDKPVVYKYNHENIFLQTERLIKVNCYLINKILNNIDKYLKYKIIIKNNNIVPLIINKLVESTILGGLGSELIIIDNDITILIPSFKHEINLYSIFMNNITKKLKKIFPKNIIFEVSNMLNDETLLQIT